MHCPVPTTGFNRKIASRQFIDMFQLFLMASMSSAALRFVSFVAKRKIKNLVYISFMASMSCATVLFHFLPKEK
jgi:hypothetical protein